MRAGWFESLTELQGRFVGVLEEKIHPYGIWVWCSGWLHESHGSGCCDHTVLMVEFAAAVPVGCEWLTCSRVVEAEPGVVIVTARELAWPAGSNKVAGFVCSAQ